MAKLLIIDDDELFRSMLSATLVHFGHTVVEASNGADGIKLIQCTEPDIIITDLVMPEMEGFEFLMKLKTHNSRAKIIVMSGGIRGLTLDFLEMATHFGAAGVLAKPFSTDALISAIDTLLPVEKRSSGRKTA
jgi:YesN/AraC family two-component response regulator